ncbi:MAG: MBL fold metallo-hydrolase [Gammaproteobacteria bacterium]
MASIARLRCRLALFLSSLLMVAATGAHADEHSNVVPVNQVRGPLSVMVLGSGGPMAFAGGRASAGYLIFVDGTPRILMDMGGGTFKSLAMSGTNIHTVDLMLLSHMHIDHQGEVPAMTKTIYFHARQAGAFRTAPLNFFGPGANGVPFPAAVFPDAATVPQYPSTSDYINGLFNIQTGIDRYVHVFTRAISGGVFNYTVTDIPAPPPPLVGNQSISTIYDQDGLVVKAIAVVHGPCPAVAYRIEYKGHSIVYSGDTDSQTNNMVKIAQGADLLIYDTSITDTLPNGPNDAVFFKLHTTPTRMGQVAAAAGVKHLLLSHLTPITAPRLDEVKSLIRDAGFTGVLTSAHDLEVLNLMDDDAGREMDWDWDH